MPERTLGQIAFEASQQWQGFITGWDVQSLAQQAYWEHIGSAVAQAVMPLAFQAGDDDA